LTQKWVKKYLIFSSSTKIFRNPGTRDFFQNTFFARLQIGLFFTFCLFFPVPGFFKKSSYRKIPVLEKVKNLFFSRLSNGFHVFGSGECLGGRKKHVFSPSPLWLFVHSITMARFPENP
jgi:hypothetical protein